MTSELFITKNISSIFNILVAFHVTYKGPKKKRGEIILYNALYIDFAIFTYMKIKDHSVITCKKIPNLLNG